MRRPAIRHQPVADALRSLPGQWGHVADYRIRYTALSMADFIHKGRLPAYRPAGTFQAEVRPGQGADGDPAVWARYVGQAAS